MVILVPVLNHICFGWTVIAICKPETGYEGFPVIGCSGRPAFWFEIPDIQEIMVADSPAWITSQVSFLSGYMTFLSMHYIPSPLRIGDALIFAFKHTEEAPACHHFRYIDTCHLKKGRSHIDHAGKIINDAARGLDPGSPADGQGDPCPPNHNYWICNGGMACHGHR